MKDLLNLLCLGLLIIMSSWAAYHLALIVMYGEVTMAEPNLYIAKAEFVLVLSTIIIAIVGIVLTIKEYRR